MKLGIWGPNKLFELLTSCAPRGLRLRVKVIAATGCLLGSLRPPSNSAPCCDKFYLNDQVLPSGSYQLHHIAPDIVVVAMYPKNESRAPLQPDLDDEDDVNDVDCRDRIWDLDMPRSIFENARSTFDIGRTYMVTLPVLGFLPTPSVSAGPASPYSTVTASAIVGDKPFHLPYVEWYQYEEGSDILDFKGRESHPMPAVAVVSTKGSFASNSNTWIPWSKPERSPCQLPRTKSRDVTPVRTPTRVPDEICDDMDSGYDGSPQLFVLGTRQQGCPKEPLLRPITPYKQVLFGRAQTYPDPDDRANQITTHVLEPSQETPKVVSFQQTPRSSTPGLRQACPSTPRPKLPPPSTPEPKRRRSATSDSEQHRASFPPAKRQPLSAPGLKQQLPSTPKREPVPDTSQQTQQHCYRSTIPNYDSNIQGVIKQWVNQTRVATSVPFTPLSTSSTSFSTASSPKLLAGNVLDKRPVSGSSQSLILELAQMLQDGEQYAGIYASSTVDHEVYSIESSPPTTDASGFNESPNSVTTSGSTPLRQSETSLRPHFRSFDREEDEHPAKKPHREQGSSYSHTLSSVPLVAQMPCPFLERCGCLGANATISELLRSIQNRHRTVVCKDCCVQLKIPLEERKVENIMRKHISQGCEPRCISRTCAGTSKDDEIAPHRRTENCPSWKAIPKDNRWIFIWTLVNPNQTPPVPDFSVGVGFEHLLERRPTKQQTRARGADICNALTRDIEAKDKRISKLEHDLSASVACNSQLQQHCDDKIGNLENIIETLLELTEEHVKIPKSLQKRLQSECPKTHG